MTQSIKKVSGIGSIALATFMLLVLPLSFAKADDGGDYSFDYSYPDSGYSYDYSYPDQSGYSYDYSYPDSTGYSTPSYSTGGYTAGGYTTGGYSTGGYMVGGYGTGGYMVGGGYPVTTHSTPSNTTVTTTNNTCTNNSCNHDDHSVVNIQNPAPVINNNTVVATAPAPAPVCAAGYYGTYPNCYYNHPVAPIAQPVVYGNTPYVSLSQVPYTGLDLGFWGTIAYWGFLVGFALFAAYLIAIKRVQNNLANYLKAVLFGSEVTEEEATPVTTTVEVAPVAAPKVENNADVIDSFIMSQINRARHA